MFEGIINRAQRSIDSLVSTYVIRLTVAVPFIISVGFITAAAVVWLSQEFGALTAYTVLAGIFAVVGVLAMAVSAAMEPRDDTPSEELAQEATATDTVQSAPAVDAELILTTLGAVGPVALPAILRLFARNLPLLIGILVLAFLLFSDAKKADERAGEAMI